MLRRLADRRRALVPRAGSGPRSASSPSRPTCSRASPRDDVRGRLPAGHDAQGRCRRSTSTTSPRSGLSVADAVAELVDELPRVGRITFRRLTAGLVERLEVIVRFLAVLELFKQGLVDLDQADAFGDIEMRWLGEDGLDGDDAGTGCGSRPAPSTTTTADMTDPDELFALARRRPGRRRRRARRRPRPTGATGDPPTSCGPSRPSCWWPRTRSPPDLLAQLLELPVATVEQLCQRLADAYDEAGHGFQLVRVAGGYRFQSHPDLAPYVERFVLEGQIARLSAAALETLAIVAYKQPISRAQVAAIRGVDADGVLRTLQSRGYVDQVGPRPRARPGRAVRHDAAVPRAPRPRLARRPAAARRLRARRRRGRGARGRAAASDRSPAEPGRRRRRRRRRTPDGRRRLGPSRTPAAGDGERRRAPTADVEPGRRDRRGSGCRRCWRSGASAAGGSARS